MANKVDPLGEVHELVIVGSGGVGKSCLTVRFLKDEFTSEYDPTIEENYRKNVKVDNLPCTAYIIDTAGQHEYTALRDQHLKEGKGFLMVFSLADKNSLEEAKQLREQIIKLKGTRKIPFVICANKCDLPAELIEVDQQECNAYWEQFKIPVLATSAKENINVSESFEMLVRECRRLEKPSGSDKPKDGKKKTGKKGGYKWKCTIL